MSCNASPVHDGFLFVFSGAPFAFLIMGSIFRVFYIPSGMSTETAGEKVQLHDTSRILC